jgi:dienelactone hydrolase
MKNYFQSVVIILMMATSISLNAQNSSASIKGEEITYSDGSTVLKGYVAYNENQKGKRPAIIVVPEWWGCSEYVRMRARKLAELGYIAIAADERTTVSPQVLGRPGERGARKIRVLLSRVALAARSLHWCAMLDIGSTCD